MTNDQFNALVARLEDQARLDPKGYQTKVLLLALLGNGYLGIALLLIVALLVGLAASIAVLKGVAIKLILVVGVFLWMILKALWIRVEPPEGVELSRSQAPELFAMIEDLQHRLAAPRFHHVLITDEFNASVVQSPRLGIFGWPRNYLLIGLPLIKTLSAEQFKAVLAHEFGHLARQHGQVSNWIYRQRLRWARIMAVLEVNESKGSFLFRPFLNWFVPYFNAYSFPLARANEYEADATAVRFTSGRAAAEALTSVNVVGSYLVERYWPQIYRQADDQPQPGFAPYAGMGHRVATELDATCTQAWLDQAMARETDSTDTHPALQDRLKAMGETPRLAPPQPNQTADRLLGSALDSLTERFDRRWQDGILPSWEQRHRAVQEGRSALAALNARHEVGEELPLAEAIERATLTEDVADDADAALEQFRALHERAPDDAAVCLGLGARLLARNDDSGCTLLEKAIGLDENAILKGCELLRDYHWRHDRKDEAQTWHQRLIERAQLLEAAQTERHRITLNDKFERHGLSAEACARLRDQLSAIPHLRKAYLVRKRVKHLADQPCHVLGFSVSSLFGLHRKKRIADALQRIQETVELPGETLIINVDGDNYRFGRKFRWMRGSRVR